MAESLCILVVLAALKSVSGIQCYTCAYFQAADEKSLPFSSFLADNIGDVETRCQLYGDDYLATSPNVETCTATSTSEEALCLLTRATVSGVYSGADFKVTATVRSCSVVRKTRNRDGCSTGDSVDIQEAKDGLSTLASNIELSGTSFCYCDEDKCNDVKAMASLQSGPAMLTLLLVTFLAVSLGYHGFA